MSESSAVQFEPEPFKDEPILELLEWLSLEGEDEWQAAAREIHARYHGFLYRVLFKPLKDRGVLEDIVLRTLGAVFKHHAKFERRKDETPEATEKRFRRWLVTIANNRSRDYLRKTKPFETRDEAFWKQVEADLSVPTEDAPPSPVVRAVEEVMAEFKDREQVIIRAWLQYCPNITNPQSKLPRDVLQELSDDLGTTKDNIRAIRSRALRRLKGKLEERGIQLWNNQKQS
jgi:RNA polymerase sigma factor (sigma-70 family)